MAQKILFIDRDGTLILEPADYQIDSFSKLVFFPDMLYWLRKIANELDYQLVMVSNQDGLGTPSFPEEIFYPVHNFLLDTLENEQIHFAHVHIDKSFPHENKPTRKPQIGMLSNYLSSDYDIQNSFVIGDRPTDIELAKNLDCKGIFIHNNHFSLPEHLHSHCALQTHSWEQIFLFLKQKNARTAHIQRRTNETQIDIHLNLNGRGEHKIDTGLHFFNHMLEQLAKHSLCDLSVHVKGDLHINEHHTVEDTALALGEAFKTALGNKLGIERYGFALPMDDAIAFVALDFGGRPWIKWEVNFQREKIGDVPTELFFHFFKSFTDTSLSNLFIQCKADNEHHKIEAIFKCFAKAIKSAVKKDDNNLILPTTKGVL